MEAAVGLTNLVAVALLAEVMVAVQRRLLLHLLLLLLRQVGNWRSVTAVILFIGLLIPDVFILLRVLLFLLCPLIIKICLLFLFMLHNCPTLIFERDVNGNLIFFSFTLAS